MSRIDVNAIKQSIDPAAFYALELPTMKPRPGNWVNGGLCPFHADNNPKSFFVNQDTGAYRCFSCNAKGADIIAFTMQLNDLEFTDAIKQLSADWR